MWRISFALRLVLALSVALVSVHTAIGRAEAAAASEIQLCTGSQVVTVTLDTKGQPVTRHPVCPDCVLSALGVLATASDPRLPIARAHAIDRPTLTRSVTPAVLPRAHARGPPVPLQS